MDNFGPPPPPTAGAADTRRAVLFGVLTAGATNIAQAGLNLGRGPADRAVTSQPTKGQPETRERDDSARVGAFYTRRQGHCWAIRQSRKLTRSYLIQTNQWAKKIRSCTEIQAWFWQGCECEVESEGEPLLLFDVDNVERYGRQGKIRTAPNWLIIAHDLFGMRVRIAEVMTSQDVKKQFGQRLFSHIDIYFFNILSRHLCRYLYIDIYIASDSI